MSNSEYSYESFPGFPYFVYILLILLLIPMVGCLSASNSDTKESSSVGSPDGQHANLDSIIQQARNEGPVNVMVRLDVSYTPEGELSQQEKQNQRQRIQEVQSRVLETLKGTKHELGSRYRISPVLALTVSAEALEELKDEKLVQSVKVESKYETQGSFSTSEGS